MASKSGQPKRRPLVWTDGQKQVLNYVFEGRITQAKMSENVGMDLRALERLIAHPDFQAKLQERRDHLIEALDDQPYIRKERRLIGLAQMAESARQEYEARPWLKETRQTGRDPETGEPHTTVNESFNRDAHAAFRESLAEIAAELGARKNLTEISGALEVKSDAESFDRRLASLYERLAAGALSRQPDAG